MNSLILALSLFGWYDSAIENPLDRAQQMITHSTSANITGAVRPWVPADWERARSLGMKVTVTLPGQFYMTIDEGRPLIPHMDMWCQMPGEGDPGWCNKTAIDWINLINSHRDEIAYMRVGDEYGCGVPYQQWLANTTNCARAAAKIEAILAEIRRWMPGIKTHVNETSQFITFFTSWRGNWRLNYFGIRLSSADYVGFDCYTPFSHCGRDGVGIYSVKTLIDNMKLVMRPHQKVILIPRAFTGLYLGWNPAPSEVSVMAWQYYSYALTEPLIEVIEPFIWWGQGGAAYNTELQTTYAAIGRLITGRQLPPPPQVTGLRIVRE